MKLLKLLFALTFTATALLSHAQDLTISKGANYKVSKTYAPQRCTADFDADGNLINILVQGSDNYIDAVEEITLVTYNDLQGTPKEINVKDLLKRKLKYGGVGYFNGKLIVYGVDKDDKKNWNYSIVAIDESGKVTGSELTLKTEFLVELTLASVVSGSGFVKSANGKYGAVYATYNGKKKDDVLVSALVFDKDMNIVSNVVKQVPDFTTGILTAITGPTAGPKIDKAILDNNGNLIGVLRDAPQAAQQVVGKKTSSKTGKGIFAFTVKNGSTELALTKLPVDGKAYLTLDIEHVDEDIYRVFGIYKNPGTGHAIVDGANTFDVDMDGHFEVGPELKSAGKFNIFSKYLKEAENSTFNYRILPSIKTDDKGTIFIVQKTNTDGYYTHHMDLYLFRISGDGFEWDVRIPAYSTNNRSQVVYDKGADEVHVLYSQQADLKMRGEDDLTPYNFSANGLNDKLYVVSIDKKGDITVGDESKQSYPGYTVSYAVKGTTVYQRVYAQAATQEHIRKIEIK